MEPGHQNGSEFQAGASRSPSTDLLGDKLQPQQLQCYQVGDFDWFAAFSPEQALELMHEEQGDAEEYSVVQSTDAQLDERWGVQDEPGVDGGCLREWLAAAVEPGWLAGTEP